jgi:hypothetical protein
MDSHKAVTNKRSGRMLTATLAPVSACEEGNLIHSEHKSFDPVKGLETLANHFKRRSDVDKGDRSKILHTRIYLDDTDKNPC